MNNTILPDVTVGSGQPSMGRVALTLMFVGMFGLFALFANAGWDSMPILGDVVRLLATLVVAGFGIT